MAPRPPALIMGQQLHQSKAIAHRPVTWTDPLTTPHCTTVTAITAKTWRIVPDCPNSEPRQTIYAQRSDAVFHRSQGPLQSQMLLHLVTPA